MNAIILSREDAKLLGNKWIGKYFPAEPLLEKGTPGLSWLSVVPDDDLHRLACAMGWQYDQGAADQHDDRLERQISEEIRRRDSLKSPKD